ncbi:MAG: cyclic nucleotide-binding domain-containing protein [Minicystis sp.]
MITSAELDLAPVTRRRSILRDSVIAASFGADELALLEALGEVVEVPPGAPIFRAGEPAEHLHVVLEGALVPAAPPGEMPAFWVGPGDVCGEVAFLLGLPRTTTLIALGPAPRVWRVHRDILAKVGGLSGVAATKLLAALARVVRARLEATASSAAALPGQEFADADHLVVKMMARRLARATQRDTAMAIWAALWSMPYRFGSWQWSASDTLARGHGMCTTKAILQVALMRAAGIEAGYVMGELDGALVRACMPAAYHARFQRPSFKHYYAAARLSGRWTPLDASFSRGSLSLIAQTETHVKPFVAWDAREAGYAHGAASLAGTDPFAIEVHQDLGDVLRKAPSYDTKNADAMNVLLDRAQGYVAPAPAYVEQMEKALAAGSQSDARRLVAAGLFADAARLRAGC